METFRILGLRKSIQQNNIPILRRSWQVSRGRLCGESFVSLFAARGAV
jgi:hypothetical protein